MKSEISELNEAIALLKKDKSTESSEFTIRTAMIPIYIEYVNKIFELLEYAERYEFISGLLDYNEYHPNEVYSIHIKRRYYQNNHYAYKLVFCTGYGNLIVTEKSCKFKHLMHNGNTKYCIMKILENFDIGLKNYMIYLSTKIKISMNSRY